MKDRKANRLERYDDSRDGCCFVTICVKEGQSSFGEIIQDGMVLSHAGEIVASRWQWLSGRYDDYEYPHGIQLLKVDNQKVLPSVFSFHSTFQSPSFLLSRYSISACLSIFLNFLKPRLL